MNIINVPSRAQLASTTSAREGALLVGTDTKTNLGNATTVEAALTSVDTFIAAINETIDDRVGTLLVAGSNVTLTYNDGSNTLTVAASVGSHTHTASEITDFSEAVDDRVNGLLEAGGNISLSYNDAGGKLTISASLGSHTHTASEITDFSEAVDDRVGTLLVAGSNITLTYNDGSNTLTIGQTAGTAATLPLIDGNGNEWIVGSATGSAVNHLSVTNAATANSPILGAAGDDTNINLRLAAKGTGVINPTSEVLFSKQIYHSEIVTATDGATVTFDISLGNLQQVVLGGSRTLTVSNPLGATIIRLRICQDGTGGWAPTWDGGMTIKWAGGSAPTLDDTPNKATWIVLIRTGSNAYDGAVLSGPH